MAGNKNQFIAHIEEGMSRFGMSLESSAAIGDELNKLVLKDNAHGTGYVALARRADVKNPGNFWGKVIDNQLKNALQESAYKGEALPAALIVPSNEADAVIAQSAQRGTKPSVYQLFDGYVVIGYNRKDSQRLLSYDPDAGQEENEGRSEPPRQTTLESAQLEPPQTEPVLKMPDIQSFLDEPKKTSAIDPRKLAAAALLGVSIASIPFAINKLKDNPQAIEDAVANPVAQNILTNINEGREGSKEILAALAANASLPDYDLEKLISEGYLREIAQNPNINSDMLRRFAADPDPFVRAAAARNRSLSEGLLRQLAADSSPAVRASAASNPNLPPELLDKLSADKERSVSSAVLDNPNMTPLLLDRIEPNIERATCANKEKIFAGPCVSLSTISYNATNPDPCIRRGVAKNPRTGRNIINALRNDGDRLVRDRALSNPSMDAKDLMEVFPESWGGTGGPEDGKPERIEDIQAALKNNATPAFVLHRSLVANPGKYGEAAAHSLALSGRDAAFLYDYSVPRGGMGGFFTAVNSLPQDMVLISLMKNSVTDGGTLPAGFVSALRGRVNRLFADNLYNPVTAAQLMESFSERPAAAVEKAGGRSADKYGPDRLTLQETEEGGGFFEEEPILTLDDKEFDRFGEFFDDDEPMPGNTDTLLKTADSIVDDIMDELMSAMEKAFAATGSGNVPAGVGAGARTAADRAVSPGAKATGDVSGVNSISFADTAARGRQSGPAASVLSDELYGKSCKQIDSMLRLF